MWIAGTFENHTELRQGRVGQPFAGNRAPWLEPFPASGQRADTRFQSVGHDQHGVEGKQRWDFGLIRLKLLERRPDRGVLVYGTLQLDDPQWQAVSEKHDVGPPLALVLDNSELIDGEPVVGFRVVEVKDVDLTAANPTVGVDVFYRHASDELPVEFAIASFQRRPDWACQLAQCIFERVVGEIGIEPGERGPQAVVECDLAVVRAFRRRSVRPDVRAVGDSPSKRRQPVERHGFDGRFRQGWIDHAPTSVRFHALRPMRADVRARMPAPVPSPAALRR